MFLGDGVAIVKAEVIEAAVVFGDAEANADGFGMPDVEIAARFRRKSGMHFSVISIIRQVLLNFLADEIEIRFRGGFFVVFGAMFWVSVRIFHNRAP